jgi:VWFA-related protein
MRAGIAAILILVSASCPIFAQEAQQAEQPVFRAGVAMVRVDAQVIDGRKVVSGMTREDFVVYDEGVPQPIQYFARDSEPLWLVLLLDVSGSMKRRLQEMAAVSRNALAALGQEDRVAVMFFGRDTRLAQEFTENREPAADAIGQAHDEKSVGSGTAINAAVLSAAQHIREHAGAGRGRRAIVILTDNVGLNYQTPDEMVLEALYTSDSVLNAIVTPDAKPPDPPRPGVELNPDFTPSDVFRLARETGGETLRAQSAGETFREMLERIRLRYSLHYRAPESAPGSVRRIRVDLSPEARRRYRRAEVRARSGYVVPK